MGIDENARHQTFGIGNGEGESDRVGELMGYGVEENTLNLMRVQRIAASFIIGGL